MLKHTQLGIISLVQAICLFIIVSILPAQAGQISSFRAGDGGWHLGTLTVGNLDNDPDLEIVIPYRNSSGQWVLDAYKYNGQRLPGFPYNAGSQEMNTSPTLFDLDGDGRDEIFITRANSVVVLRPDGSEIWSTTINNQNYVPNGGFMTITNGFHWSDGGNFISRLPDSAVFSSQVSPPIVADLKGDGRLQVVTGWKIDPDPVNGSQDFNPFINDIFGSGEWGTMGETWSGGVVLFDALSGAKNFVYHIHQLVESGLAIGRADTDLPTEVYVLNDSDSVVCFDPSKPHGLWGSGMLHKQFGKNQRLMSGAYQMPGDIYAADIDGDGLDEVLVAGTQMGTTWEPNETILDDDGKILWRQLMPKVSYPNVWGWRNSSCMIPVNPDNDNHIDVLGYNHGHEISFRYWNGVELVDHEGWSKAVQPPLLPTPPVVGDVDGDGEQEIIFGTYNPAINPSEGNLYIYALNGTLKFSLAVPGGIKHIPTLADVNHDGSLDLVYRSLLGQVYVHNFGPGNPAAVSWATHRGNARHDGNHGTSLFPPGTPMITSKSPGYRQAAFTWTPMPGATGYRIRRAPHPQGPFVSIATVTSSTTSFSDAGLQSGWQYVYEVGAIYNSTTVYSAPFAIVPSGNNNLIANSGFEENDHSHWDKWFTGDIELTNMLATSDAAHQGRHSMQIRLQNKPKNSTIAQFCQYGIPDGSIPVTPGKMYSFGGWIGSPGLSQASEQWFEWASGKTAYDTNNRPSLPYPNYFTPHFVMGTTPTNWMYLNRTFIMPAGFPNIDLRHRYTVPAPASGSVFLDDIFFRQLPAPGATNWVEWLPFGSTWRYHTAPAQTGWFAPGFDDSSWPLGLAKFGAGDGPNNITTRLPQNKSAYFFRTEFVVDSPSVEEFLLSATCTDDYGGSICPLRMWINGTEIISSGIETVTGQGNQVRYFDLLPFVDLVQPGTNSIAIRLGNIYQSTWDDVAFDISLRVIPDQRAQPARLTVVNAQNQLNMFAETPPQTIWWLENCPGLSGSWQKLTCFTNSTGAPQLLLRLQPENVSGSLRSGFYRLAPY